MPVYVVDTSAINRIADGRFKPEAELPADAEFVITHIQLEEMNDTKDKDKERRALLAVVNARLRPRVVPVETLVWGHIRFDLSKFSDGVMFNELRAALDALNKAKPNNARDALIAEVALKNNWILLTADRDLRRVTEEKGGTVHFIEAARS